MDTLGTLITLLFGILVAMGGAEILRDPGPACRAAYPLHPTRYTIVITWVIYLAAGAGTLLAGTLVFGLTLLGMIF